MKAEILSVGTELLLGNIVDTNAAYLARELASLGISVYFKSTVGDNPERLREVVRTAIERSDLVVTTGGLGPTSDDITKDVIAEVLGAELVMDERAAEEIRSFFRKIGREMPAGNLRQAMVPKDGVVFYNDLGTAPGVGFIKDGKVVVCMPGVPREMYRMWEKSVAPFLMERLAAAGEAGTIASRTLRVFGVGESTCDAILDDIMRASTNPTLAPYAKDGEVHLRITAKAPDRKTAEEMIDRIDAEVRSRLGDAVYGQDERALEHVVGDLLRAKGLRLATAESCTGGLIGEMITSVAGSSDYYDRGFVTYSNAAKTELLGVDPEIIARHGAVSHETCLAMAQGARNRSRAELAIAVTGIAGPGGGTPEKPVGTVYIGVAVPEGSMSGRFSLPGDRAMVRRRAAMNALNIVRMYLLRGFEGAAKVLPEDAVVRRRPM